MHHHRHPRFGYDDRPFAELPAEFAQMIEPTRSPDRVIPLPDRVAGLPSQVRRGSIATEESGLRWVSALSSEIHLCRRPWLCLV